VLLFAALGLVILSVPLFGGHFGALRQLRIQKGRFLVAALALQVLVLEVLASQLGAGIAALLHVASYSLAVVFLWWNRHIRGLWLIGIGGLCNLVAIAANGGVMPASPSARAAAGLADVGGEFANSAPIAAPRLAFLGDVFAWPASVPLANVFSVGDVLLVVGAAVVLHAAAGSRLPHRRAALAATN
jgi:hypothetical protein